VLPPTREQRCLFSTPVNNPHASALVFDDCTDSRHPHAGNAPWDLGFGPRSEEQFVVLAAIESEVDRLIANSQQSGQGRQRESALLDHSAYSTLVTNMAEIRAETVTDVDARRG
jgi:hypothetical protein